MSSHAKPTTATVIPCLRYRNAPAMIERPCKAFGFEKHAVYADGDVVQHAQLTFGNGMIMPGSADNASEWGRHIAQPDEVGDQSWTNLKPGIMAAAAMAVAIRKATCGGSATTIRGRTNQHEDGRRPHHG